MYPRRRLGESGERARPACWLRRLAATSFPGGISTLRARSSRRRDAGASTRDARARAPGSAQRQRGESPLLAPHWVSVAESNCVAERRGGKQLEANCQSIIKKMMKSIRPYTWASLRVNGEAKKRIPACKGRGNPAAALRGTVSVTADVYGVVGYRMAGSRCDVNQGSRSGIRRKFTTEVGPKSLPEGDRAPVVAQKRGNSRGAKGGRKLTIRETEPEPLTTDVVPLRANSRQGKRLTGTALRIGPHSL